MRTTGLLVAAGSVAACYYYLVVRRRRSHAAKQQYGRPRSSSTPELVTLHAPNLRRANSAPELAEQVLSPVAAPVVPALAKAKKAVAAATTESDLQQEPSAWSASQWIGSLQLLHCVEDALLAPLQAGVGEQKSRRGDVQLAYLKALGSSGVGVQAVRAMLDDTHVLDSLAEELCSGLVALGKADAATSADLNSKFQADGSAFQLSFGSFKSFFGGLEGLLAHRLRVSLRR